MAAYKGYNVRYAHAGSPKSYVVEGVNASLIEAAVNLLEAAGTGKDVTMQRHVLDEYQSVL